MAGEFIFAIEFVKVDTKRNISDKLSGDNNGLYYVGWFMYLFVKKAPNHTGLC